MSRQLTKIEREERSPYLEAFLNQYNLIVMAAMIVLSIITWSWIPLAVAAGIEAMYLALFPDTKAYEHYIERKYAEINRAESVALLTSRLDRLTIPQRQAYENVAALVESTEANFRDKQSDTMYHSMLAKLEQLREHFLRMIELVNSYDHYLSGLDYDEIKRARERVERQTHDASDRLKRSLNERLDILDKRLIRLERVRENRAIVRTQLDTIADMMRFFYESSLTMDNPQGISQKVDDLLIDLESTEETVLDFDDAGVALDSFDEQLEAAAIPSARAES